MSRSGGTLASAPAPARSSKPCSAIPGSAAALSPPSATHGYPFRTRSRSRLPRARGRRHPRPVDHFTVFARWPAPGRVKTRLGPALSPDLACALYQAMLRDVLETGRATEVETRWLDWADAPDGERWGERAAGYRETAQRGADLGERLSRAFEERLCGSGDRMVVVGADAPELTAEDVARAFWTLATHDVVLGPTRDGGYWLIAMAKPSPELFRDIPWGNESVLAATISRAVDLGLRVAHLDRREDVDTPEDLVRLLRRCLEGGAKCPRTIEALRGMCLLPPPRRTPTASAGPA
jgi:uncharacterized protein